MNWVRFFVGTPARLLMTLMGFAALAAVSALRPGLIESSLNQLARELSPLFQMALMLIIIGIGVRIMTSGFRRPKK
jgi:hypothetical protein